MQYYRPRDFAIFVMAINIFHSATFAGSPDAFDGSDVPGAVRAVVDAYGHAWNTHDAASVAAFFSEDADMVMGNGPRVNGRTAIQDWWGHYFGAIDEQRTGTFAVESIRLIAPDVALVNVTSRTAVDAASPANCPPGLPGGHG